MNRFNLHRAELYTAPDDPPGYRTGWAAVAQSLGAQRLAANLLEIEPHGAATPYHWEAAEEWVLVLDGVPTLRTPDGHRDLRPGDVACFAPGPGGAHQVLNRTGTPVRILMLSDVPRSNAYVYRDADKVALARDDEHGRHYRRGDRVGYWDGEPTG